MKLTLTEIAEMTGGRLLSGDGRTEIRSFFTDSREACPGGMFVPIRGENQDGHAFIAAAMEKGGSASFTDHPIEGIGPLVLVEDCRSALQRVGERIREGFTLPIVGITGSVGKTTAKEMTAQALSAGHQVYRTPGNANSQVGVPITMCGICPEHTAAVIEMGVSMPGEMARIARVVKPTCGIVTTIGTSHIEFMKTRENILAEKLHITDFLPKGAPLFVNGDNDLLSKLNGGENFQVVSCGLGDGCQWRGRDVREEEDGLRFICVPPDGREQEIYLPVAGEHNVRNALTALAVAEHLGVGLSAAAEALKGYIPPKMRQQISEENGVILIDDSYNASPDSMRSALEVLAGRKVSGRKIAVLAGMRELGDYTRTGHLDTGSYAKSLGVDTLIAVGELGELIAEGYGPEAISVRDNREAAERLRELLSPGDAVLIKGSRGMKTEEIVSAVKRDRRNKNEG